MFICIVVANERKMHILAMAFATWSRISNTLSPNDNMFHTPGIRGKVQNRYLANKVWPKVPAKGVHSFEFLVGTSNYCTCQQSYNQIFLAQFLAITELLWILLFQIKPDFLDGRFNHDPLVN